MGIFSRCQITLEFDSTANFKFKTALKKKVVDNDGIVSFIVTKKVSVIRVYGHEVHVNVMLCASVSGLQVQCLNDKVSASILITAHRRPRPLLYSMGHLTCATTVIDKLNEYFSMHEVN